ncbi:MAG TPA: hydrogenase maturation protease [Bacteroidota bacterium]|nr:hydrogenase maturation protease [Bacteroidota bacterium]
MPERQTQALLLALGNPLLGDDGVAPLAARALGRRYRDDVDINESPVAGFALLDLLSGYDRALIIDASATGGAPPGTVREFTQEEFTADASTSPHYAGLPDVLALARRLGIPLPAEIRILGMEIENQGELHEGLGPVAAGSLPEFLRRAGEILDTWVSRP